MGLSIAPRSAVEDFIMEREATLAARQNESAFESALTKKVTIRLNLHHYAALQLLAARYDGTITAVATDVLEAAAMDAAQLAGFTSEDLTPIVEDYWEKAKRHQKETGDGLSASLAAVEIEISNGRSDAEEL